MTTPMRLIPTVFLVFALAGLSTAQVVPGQLYLKFNEGTGTSTVDGAIPGSGVLATLQGSAGWEIGNPYLGAASLKTGPTGNDVCTTNVAFSLSGSWTIEFAFTDLNTASFTNTLFGDASAGGFACTKSVGVVGAFLTLSGGGISAVSVPNTTAAVWNHIAYVHDAGLGDIKLYQNGNLLTTVAQPPGLTITGTSLNGLVIGGDSIGGPGWSGRFDEFRIWNVARSQGAIIANMGQELIGYTDDLGIVSLDAPSAPSQDCAGLAATETISFTVANGGANTIAPGASFVASYSINGNPPVLETFFFATALSHGQTSSFSFGTPADLSMPGEREIALNVNYLSDQNGANDDLTELLAPGVGLVTSFPWTEDFDSLAPGATTTPPAGWSQDDNDAMGAEADWYFRDGPTPTGTTGPSADHTSGMPGQGHYAHVEDSQANHAQVNLLSPCLDLTTLSTPHLVFWAHSLNDQTPSSSFENFLSVDVLQPSGVVTMDALGPIGHLGPGWQRLTLDLTPFAGGVVQLRFRGRSDGGGGRHDIAIDDVAVAVITPGNGQAPQVGLAVLDVNNASSPQFGVVSSGDNGPYSAEATAGGPLHFEFEGMPGEPVILLFGNLNPVAATFAGIGQMDIGGLPDPITGIPVGIQVLGNGHNPVDFIDLLFVLAANGQTSLAVITPPLPAGPVGAFQTANLTGLGIPVALSNAVELTIL